MRGRVVLGLALALAACSGGGGKPHPRGQGSGAGSGSASAPFELVDPSARDAGTGPIADEIEPNDTDEQATPLPLGGTLRGKLDPDTDVDRYKLDVAQAGALSVMVSAVDADLALELEDASGAVVAKSDRGGVRVREGIPNFGVQPGRYTAVVRLVKHKAKKAAAGSGDAAKPPPVYEISASVAPPAPGAEREPDEDRGAANDLIIGDTGTGYLGWSGDTDVWKLSIEALSAKDAIDVELSAVDGVAYDVELDDGVGALLVHRKTPRGAPLSIQGLVPAVPAGAPPFHYVVVKASGSNPETPYQLRVTAHVLGTDAEVEPDDTPDKPFALPPDRTVVHATWSPGDVDCFALAPSASARTVDAAIDPSGDVALSAELLADGKSIAITPAAGKGAGVHVSGQVPASAKVVVRVRGDDRGAAGAYDIKVTDNSQGDNGP